MSGNALKVYVTSVFGRESKAIKFLLCTKEMPALYFRLSSLHSMTDIVVFGWVCVRALAFFNCNC
jgi:hypothetical protein